MLMVSGEGVVARSQPGGQHERLHFAGHATSEYQQTGSLIASREARVQGWRGVGRVGASAQGETAMGRRCSAAQCSTGPLLAGR